MRKLIFAPALLLLAACADPGPPPGGSVPDLQRIDESIGQGEVATSAAEVTVHYFAFAFAFAFFVWRITAADASSRWSEFCW